MPVVPPSTPGPSRVSPTLPLTTVQLDGTDLVQSVQSEEHAVHLVKGKSTLMRIYLTHTGSAVVDPGGHTIDVSVAIRDPNDGNKEVERVTPLERMPLASVNISLSERRLALDHSLNVLLPEQYTHGDHNFTILDPVLYDESGSSTALTFAATGATFPNPSFWSDAPALRLRLIGLRYRDATGRAFAPRVSDFDHTTGWLGRAFPVVDVESTTELVDSGAVFTTAKGVHINQALAQVTAIRGLELSYGWEDGATGLDRRSRYYGMVYDARVWTTDVGAGSARNATFMRGSISGEPEHATIATVGAGPVGVPTGAGEDGKPFVSPDANFAFDTDETFGDWYAGHEIGHLLGRRHVDSWREEAGSDTAYPHPGGHIGDDRAGNVGVDLGTDPPTLMTYHTAHDLMSYGPSPWLSPYTYTAIHERLVSEEARTAAVPAPRSGVDGYRDGKAVALVAARIDPDDEDDEQGDRYRIAYVHPVPSAFYAEPPLPAHPDAVRVDVWAKEADGTEVLALPVPVAAAHGGFVDVAVPLDGDELAKRTICRFELVVRGKVQATFAVGAAPKPVVVGVPAPQLLEKAAAAGPAAPVSSWLKSDGSRYTTAELATRYPEQAKAWRGRLERAATRGHLLRVVTAELGRKKELGPGTVAWEVLEEGARSGPRIATARSVVLADHGKDSDEWRYIEAREKELDAVWGRIVARVEKRYTKDGAESTRVQGDAADRGPLRDALHAVVLARCVRIDDDHDAITADSEAATTATAATAAAQEAIMSIRTTLLSSERYAGTDVARTRDKEYVRTHHGLWERMTMAVRAIETTAGPGVMSEEWNLLTATDRTTMRVLAEMWAEVQATYRKTSPEWDRMMAEVVPTRIGSLFWAMAEDDRADLRAVNGENAYAQLLSWNAQPSAAQPPPDPTAVLTWNAQAAGVTYTVFARTPAVAGRPAGPLRVVAVGLDKPGLTVRGDRARLAPGDTQAKAVCFADEWRVMATNGTVATFSAWFGPGRSTTPPAKTT